MYSVTYAIYYDSLIQFDDHDRIWYSFLSNQNPQGLKREFAVALFYCSGVSIVNFEQAIADWVYLLSYVKDMWSR